MSPRIISSIENFKKAFPGLANEQDSSERIEALKNYFNNGGVVSLAKTSSGWPKLLYPSPKRIEEQLKEVLNLKNVFVQKHRDWESKERNARVYYLKHEVLKLSEPLYWKHIGKLLLDRDYEEDSRLVKLPANLVADKRWQPMIKTFINDIEYRKQLVETVQHSIVYEKNKKVGAFAKELQNFRQDVSSKKLVQIKKKLDSLETEIKVLQSIHKWAKE